MKLEDFLIQEEGDDSRHLPNGELAAKVRGINFKDISGQVFGYLTVLRENGRTKRNLVRWLCQCECGNQITVDGQSLRLGRTKSCGCQSSAMTSAAITKHGLKHLPEYRVWKAMRDRCNRPNNTQFKDYGGRGIKVCARWNCFPNFLADMGARPSPKHSIDRWPDRDGNYEPNNCRWATASEQCKNKKTSISVTIDNRTQNLTDWVAEFGLKYSTVTARIRRGLSPMDALQWRA
jgi:hypothetical protein